MDKIEVEVKRERDYISKKIYSWFKGENKIFKISSSPFNSVLIFKDIITYLLDRNLKVLYVHNEGSKIKDILQGIKQSRTVGRIKSGVGEFNLNIVKFHDLENIRGEYSLIILEDISQFTTLTKKEFLSKIDIGKELSEKVLVYAIEEGYIGGEEGRYPYIGEKPFCEPRIISTRIDLNKDIPYSLYDYIKWFQKEKENLIIYVPDKKSLDKVYNYYTNKLKLTKVSVEKIPSNSLISIKNVLKMKEGASFIITDNKEISLEGTNISNGIVLFGEDKEYTLRNLIFISGQITRNSKNLSELLIVLKDETEVIDKMRDLTREYNKMLWQINLRE